MTRQYNNYEDMITFTRASTGTALRPVTYGDELVTNGTFDSDTTGWTTQSGTSVFTVSSGQLTISRSAVDPGYVWQIIPTTSGNVYYVSFAVVDDGPIDVRIGTSPGALQIASSGIKSSAGTYTLVFVATGSTAHVSAVNTSYSVDATIDNISVKEVTFDQPDGTLTLFNHPNNVPRIEYDADGNWKGLLIEESRTNLLTYSEDFTDAYWSKTSSAPVLDATGPDGQSNSACTLIDNNGGGTGTVRVFNTITVSTSTTYTFSVFAKADQLDQLAILPINFTTPAQNYTYFDLSGGTVVSVGAGQTATIEDAGNGWYRCATTFTTDAVDTSGNLGLYVASGGSVTVDLDGTSSILIYGAQFEEGAFPTSYIPTSGATATRSADVASMNVSDFGYNQSEGSMLVEYTRFGTGNAWTAFLLETTNTYIALAQGNSGSEVRFQVADSGVAQCTINTATVVVGTPYKQAAAFRENDFASCDNGGTVGTDTSGVLPDGIVTLDIGEQYSNYLNGHIKSIQYYPRRLSNAQLQALTS